jgi:hypothetical protein
MPNTVLLAGAGRVSHFLSVLADPLVDSGVQIESITLLSKVCQPQSHSQLSHRTSHKHLLVISPNSSISKRDIVWVTEVETAVETLPSCRRKQHDFSFDCYGVHS